MLAEGASTMANPLGCVLYIPLHGREDGKRCLRGWAKVDPQDRWLLARRWNLSAFGYAVRYREAMHRAVLGLPAGNGMEVDHINRDKLDNRRRNLRVVERGANAQNLPAHANSTSTHRGVCWAKHANKWRAYGAVSKRLVHLGYFNDELDAAEAAANWRRENLPYANN